MTVKAADAVANGVSFLFVPGDRPERFVKASAAGADAIIIDLEDAVAPGKHEMALAHTIAALHDGSIAALVRVHPITDSRHEIERDSLVALAREAGSGLLGFVVAKADDAADVAALRAELPAELALVPLVESADGLLAAQAMASVDGVTRVALGAIDFSLDIGADPEPEYLSSARSHLVVASRAARIAAPLDSPPVQITDLEQVEQGARRARGFGFGGSLAIHPAQLPAIHRGFAPSDREVEWARAVLVAEGGAAQVDGRLVDRPVTERARGILVRAAASR
jgi:citrate lyase subunit beta/citryl-CoA lyase